ncbi:MAG: RibD family protein [Candidatus Ratteibacteria bacterium]|nr:RibD family protein [Candidatus Ratteibacteria bacterium]
MKNEIAKKYRMKRKPFVTIKYAQTLDGKIAARSGRSCRISGPEALGFVHKLRAQHQAILVGVNTVIKDNPLLTVRLVKGRSPIRIILDSGLRTPLESKLILQGRQTRTIIAATKLAPKRKIELFRRRGIEVLLVPGNKKGRVNLRKLLGFLRKLKIKSLLVEGGSKVITSFLKEGLADRLIVIIAPEIMGRGLETVGGREISDIAQLPEFKFEKVQKMGRDLVVTAKPVYSSINSFIFSSKASANIP